MFVQEAEWAAATLASVSLPTRPAVLNVGSSTEHFRTVEQPHIEARLLAPLRANGAKITHLDMKDDAGVDIVCDLADPRLDLRRSVGNRRFDLVLATGLLQHFADISPLVVQLESVVADDGYLLVTTPERYRRTPDPVDHGYRPTPAELLDTFSRDNGNFEAVKAASVRIDERRYYKGLISRTSTTPVGGRWVILPGFTEQVRFLVPPLRWRETCLLLHRRSPDSR
jgi:SAM-dependent methyltransferase